MPRPKPTDEQLAETMLRTINVRFLEEESRFMAAALTFAMDHGDLTTRQLALAGRVAARFLEQVEAEQTKFIERFGPELAEELALRQYEEYPQVEHIKARNPKGKR